MTWETWLLFVITEGTPWCITPGPAVLLVVSQGLARGTAKSIWSNDGILAANELYSFSPRLAWAPCSWHPMICFPPSDGSAPPSGRAEDDLQITGLAFGGADWHGGG